MASLERRKRADGRPTWRVVWYEPGGTKTRSNPFDRERDALRFKAEIEGALHSGRYVTTSRGAVTVDDFAHQWLESHGGLTPTTRERYRGIIDNQIAAGWAGVPLSRVSHLDIQTWVTELSEDLSPASIRKIHRVLAQVFDLAVRDKRMESNPAKDIRLPSPNETERRFLNGDQLDRLAERCGQVWNPYGLMVSFLGYTGVRWGELAALKVGRLDLVRRRARIIESVTPVGRGQGMVWGMPKNKTGREVPVPGWLCDELVPLINNRSRNDLVFEGERGAVLRVRVFRKAVFDAAVADVLPEVPGFYPHELRHTAASLAIDAGADVGVVQRMLGHKDATMTLNTYRHLFEDRLDEVAEAMNRNRTARRGMAGSDPHVPQVSPGTIRGGSVIQLRSASD